MKSQLTLASFPIGGGPVDGDYWVLGTDYTTYTVVYSCSQVGFLKLELGWVLTREENGAAAEAAVSWSGPGWQFNSRFIPPKIQPKVNFGKDTCVCL